MPVYLRQLGLWPPSAALKALEQDGYTSAHILLHELLPERFHNFKRGSR